MERDTIIQHVFQSVEDREMDTQTTPSTCLQKKEMSGVSIVHSFITWASICRPCTRSEKASHSAARAVLASVGSVYRSKGKFSCRA